MSLFRGRRGRLIALLLLVVLLGVGVVVWSIAQGPAGPLGHLLPFGGTALPPGCGGSRPTFTTATLTMTSNNLRRTYLLHVPPSYSPRQPVPLVVGLHGRGGSGHIFELQSGLSALSDARGFLVVYPNGTVEGDPAAESGARTWNAGIQAGRDADLPDDVAFLRALIARVSAAYCVDPARIYATGISAGAALVDRLACQKEGPLAAIGIVAGIYVALPEGCHPARPIPVIAFHGTADPIMPYNGRVRADGLVIRGARVWAADWAARNGCTGRLQVDRPAPDAIRAARGGCRGGAQVIFYTVRDGGHTWPGMPYPSRYGRVSPDVHASALIWAFFAAHPRV